MLVILTVILSGLLSLGEAIDQTPVQSSCFLLHEKGCRMLKVFLELQGRQSCSNHRMIQHCPGLCPPCHTREEDVKPECEVDITKNCRKKSQLYRKLNPDLEECSDLSFFLQCYQYCTGCDDYWWKRFVRVVEPTSYITGPKEDSKDKKQKQNNEKKSAKKISHKVKPVDIQIQEEDINVEISTSGESTTTSDRNTDQLDGMAALAGANSLDTELDGLTSKPAKKLKKKSSLRKRRRKSTDNLKLVEQKVDETADSDRGLDNLVDLDTTTPGIYDDNHTTNRGRSRIYTNNRLGNISNISDNVYDYYNDDDEEDRSSISIATPIMPVLDDYEIVKQLVESNTEDASEIDESKSLADEDLEILKNNRDYNIPGKGKKINTDGNSGDPAVDRLPPADSRSVKEVNPTADLLSDMLLTKMQGSGYKEDTTCIDLFPDCEDYIALAELKHPGIGTCEMKMVKAVCEKSCGFCRRKKTGKNIISDHWLENYINTVKKVYEKLTHNDSRKVLPKTAIEKILNGEPSHVDEYKIHDDEY